MTATWGLVGDGADLVESFYRLDLDDRRWFEAMWRALAPLVPDSPALIAGRYTWRPGQADYHLVDVVGSDARVTAHLRAATGVSDAPSLAATLGSQKRVYTILGALGAKHREAAILRTMRSMGVADVLNLMGWCDRDGERNGVCVSASSVSFAVPMRGAARAAWEGFAAHLGAAARLRYQLAPAVEGVISPDGRVLDAEGPARDAQAQEVLRRAAIAIDRARLRGRRTDIAALLEAWRAIYLRRWTLVESTESDGRRLLLARVNPPEERPLEGSGSARERQIAALLARGVSQKAIAIELDLTPSTVGYHTKKLASRMGVGSVAELIARLAPVGPKAPTS